MKIIKKGANNFWHWYNNDSKKVAISDFEIVLDSVLNTFVIVFKNGANVPQIALSVNEIEVIDETSGSIVETFPTVELLRTRLVSLGYTPFISGVGIQTIVAGTNVTVDNTDPTNPIVSATGDGGGSQTLAQTLGLGNTTNGNNIEISDGDSILIDNGSKLKKGTTDAGNGGNNGISLKCSLDYEFKWEAGRLYIMEQDGVTIRETKYNFGNVPSATDDTSKGFTLNSRWILDNGNIYVCTDATIGVAVWELQPTLTDVELQANKQNSLVVDGTGVKYPTVDAVNAGLVNVNTDAVDKVSVKLGVAINKGQAVYVSSATGTNMIVSKASNVSEATSSKTLGLCETTGILNDQVKIITLGLFSGLDTSTATIGDPVWLGVDGNLIFGLAYKPSAPTHLVSLGIVTRVSATVGEIFVKVQNGFELNEIHDVSITTPLDAQVLTYESSTSLWKNKILPIATNLISGISKLYNAIGTEVDGGITPKAVTDALALKAGASDIVTSKNNIGIISTFNGASVSLVGGSATVTYQQLNIGVVATTNNFTMNPRTTMVSNTGSGGLSFISVNTTNSFSTNMGIPFTYDYLVGIEFYRVNAEHFFGYINSTVNPTNVSPTTFINCFGLARIKTSNNFHIIHNDAAGTPTLIDLGVNFPSNTSATDLYNVVFKNKIGVGLQYTVNRINSVGVTSNTITGIITTDLPATNLLLCQKYINADNASINPGATIVFCKSQINLN